VTTKRALRATCQGAHDVPFKGAPERARRTSWSRVLRSAQLTAEDGQIMEPSPRMESADDYEAVVRAEIGQLCATAFRPIKLNQGERKSLRTRCFTRVVNVDGSHHQYLSTRSTPKTWTGLGLEGGRLHNQERR
jgi:hypothetical protein